MTNEEKAFLATSNEYKAEVFTIVEALKTLHDSSRISSLSIGTNNEHEKFMDDVKLVLKTLNKFYDTDEDDEDEMDNDSESESEEEESVGFSATDEMETFMSNTSEALLHLTQQFAEIKFQTMLNSKAIVKLIDERDQNES